VLQERTTIKYSPYLVIKWIEEDAERLKSEGTPIHPLVYAWNTNEIISALMRNTDKSVDFIIDKIGVFFDLFARALSLCEESEFTGSRDYLFCSVVSRLDALSFALKKDKTINKILEPVKNFDKDKIHINALIDNKIRESGLETLNDRAKKLLLADHDLRHASAPLGEWCERHANHEIDPYKATELLARSVFGNPKWITAWPLFFGAIQQACMGLVDEDRIKTLRGFEKESLIYLSNNNDFRIDITKGHTDPKNASNNPFQILKYNYLEERQKLGYDYIRNQISSSIKLQKRLSNFSIS
jgi:hypothetical protein